MAEILSSIRRIISENGSDGGHHFYSDQDAGPGEDILRLTRRINGPGRYERADTRPEPYERADTRPEPYGRADTRPEPYGRADTRPEPYGRAATRPELLPSGNNEGLILSYGPSASATRAFSALNNAIADRRTAGGDARVEDLLRELMLPLLRDWLDSNLPIVVERLVRDEISHVADRSRT